MDKFHPNEENNKVPMEGTPDNVVVRRTAIKLSQGPRIMVAIPIGGKRHDSVLECPQCKDRGEEKTRFQVHNAFEPLGLVPVNFMLQHMNWMPPLNVTMSYMTKSGMLSAAARNIMTIETMKMPTVKYIFYVDDDMIIPPMGLFTLYNYMETHPEIGAVSGVYTTRTNPPEPLIYTDHGQGAAWDFELGPGAAPKQIMGAGAGCLLARVEAIASWQEANPETPVWCDSSEFPASNGGRVTWGHDVRFIRNLTEAGWPCMVHGQVLCGHYDIASRRTFEVPANAPGFKKRNINTEDYWDAIYGREGMDSWRTYEGMYSYIEEHVHDHGQRDVVELGCGSGILGQRLTAKGLCSWKGMDLSEVAVAQAKARYLDATKMDVRHIGDNALVWDGADCVIATELLEHLDPDDCGTLLSKLNTSGVGQLIFGLPWNCMPPEEVQEHQVVIDDAWVINAKEILVNYEQTELDQVDEHHAVFVYVKRQEE